MIYSDSYGAYTEGSVFSANPLEMVVALYEGTVGAIRQARECFLSGDVWGRSRAINKAVALLTELLVSLDHKEGGEISRNLKALYSYIQCRLLEAHAKKTTEPLEECERLLNTMLEGWHQAAGKAKSGADHEQTYRGETVRAQTTPESHYHSGYSFSAESDEFSGCVSALL